MSQKEDGGVPEEYLDAYEKYRLPDNFWTSLILSKSRILTRVIDCFRKKIVEAELYDAKGRMVSSGASIIPSYQSFIKPQGKLPTNI